MEVKLFDKKTDYEELSDWWRLRGAPLYHPSIIPPIGGVVFENGKKLAIGFLYLAEYCNYAQIAFVITNPENKPKESVKAINYLTKILIHMAHANNRSVIMFSTGCQSLQRLFKKNDFIALNNNFSEMMYVGGVK